MDSNRVKEILKDKAFAEQFLAAKTPEEAKALLEAHNVTLSLDEVKGLRMLMERVKKGEDINKYVTDSGEFKDELSPEELALVSGGRSIDGVASQICKP